MAKPCDFYIDKGSKYWCVVKNGEISYTTYKEFCYYDDMKKCPFYTHYLENK